MRTLILAVLMICGFQAAAEATLALGVGLESRVQPDVNPDFTTLQNSPQIYYEILFTNWGLEFDFEQQSRTSNVGDLSVDSHSTELGAWGRYMFRPPTTWSPYVALGLGGEFDRVNTRFGTSVDNRSGQEGMLGLAAGMSKSFWKVLLVEAEVRMESLQNYQQPLFAGILRLGFTTN
jgi:hypothetical protein